MGSTLTNANICVPLVNKTDHTVVEYYADCMPVCNVWVWNGNNTPKLGVLAKLLRWMKPFFQEPQVQQRKKIGNQLGQNDPWVFGMVETDSLDFFLKEVPPNRKRETLLPFFR